MCQTRVREPWRLQQLAPLLGCGLATVATRAGTAAAGGGLLEAAGRVDLGGFEGCERAVRAA